MANYKDSSNIADEIVHDVVDTADEIVHDVINTADDFVKEMFGVKKSETPKK